MNLKIIFFMNKIIYTLVLLYYSFFIYAQKKTFCEHYEKIRAQKVAYLTSKLDLSVEEAQKFWPIYNEYENKKKELFNLEFELIEKVNNFENLSEKNIDEMIDEYIKIQQKHLQLLEEYNKKFKSVLPVKKILLLYVAERMFKKEFIHHRLKEK